MSCCRARRYISAASRYLALAKNLLAFSNSRCARTLGSRVHEASKSSSRGRNFRTLQRCMPSTSSQSDACCNGTDSATNPYSGARILLTRFRPLVRSASETVLPPHSAHIAHRTTAPPPLPDTPPAAGNPPPTRRTVPASPEVRSRPSAAAPPAHCTSRPTTDPDPDASALAPESPPSPPPDLPAAACSCSPGTRSRPLNTAPAARRQIASGCGQSPGSVPAGTLPRPPPSAPAASCPPSVRATAIPPEPCTPAKSRNKPQCESRPKSLFRKTPAAPIPASPRSR